MNQHEGILGDHVSAAGERERWLFRDRAHAGAVLAANLEHLWGRNALVIGIARGGMAVAREVARWIGGELDVFVARKLGLPGQEELAMGAIASDGTRYVDRELVVQLGVSDDSLAYVTRVQSAEAQRRERGPLGPYRPDPFQAVGQYYRNFDQGSDDDVVRILDEQSPRQPS